MQNIFEYATRNKLRFASMRGELTVEQLWDVPLRSREALHGFYFLHGILTEFSCRQLE